MNEKVAHILSDMNSPSEKLQNSSGKQISLRDKSKATLSYYCSRTDLKSSSSLSSFNPGKTSLGNPVFSSDNVSRTSEETKSRSRMSVIRPEDCQPKKFQSWCKDQQLERRFNFGSQPTIPESTTTVEINSRGLHLINSKQIRSIDDDDDDDGEISTRGKVESHPGNFINLNDESLRLLPHRAEDRSDERRYEGTEVLSLSSDPLQSQTSVTRAKSKWNKIRNTVKMASAFSPTYRKKGVLEREDSFLKRFSTRQGGGIKEDQVENNETGAAVPASGPQNDDVLVRGFNSERWKHLVIGPNDSFLYIWLSVLTSTILYNLWTCIAREAFSEHPSIHTPIWVVTDVLCDVVYILDILVQFRTGYLEHGLIVYRSRKLCARYVRSKEFAMDLASLFPLDLLQFRFGIHPILRFPRFLKAYRLFRFVYMVETRTVYPNMWRVANLSHTVFLGCHWFAAFYFLISKQEGFNTEWGYPRPEGDLSSVTQKYLRSLYWSTLTLTTIGDMPPPETSWEFVFTIVSYLIGVFVFATIVGQVGNVITNRNASRQEFERHLDAAKAYMRTHNVPSDMQKRVQRWYDYAWSRGRMSGAGDINSLGLLPDKLKTELALHVNLETLKKVTIFHECEPEFLHDLVLKMMAYIFTPGDLICRKGEVAREMFIIADGLIEVVSDSGDILKQMSAGDFFGEIGILNLDGVNKRTADVRSVGYSELFVLSRDDVLSAFKDHPEAEKLIMNYGRRRLQELDEHKKKTASLAKKIREKAGSRGLRNLLSIDLSPASGSEGLLSNCSSSNRPLVTKEDKWLSLTANLLKQAQMDDPEVGSDARKTNEAVADPTHTVASSDEVRVQPTANLDESSQPESKTSLRFANWKTKWKEQHSKRDSRAKSCINDDVDDTAPTLCLLSSNTNNTNVTNTNNSNNSTRPITSTSTTINSNDNIQQHDDQSKTRSPHWQVPKSRSKHSVHDSTGASSPQASALAPISPGSRDIQDDLNAICHDITKALLEVWQGKFVAKLRTCEEQMLRLEFENRKQQEIIENLQHQLKHCEQ